MPDDVQLSRYDLSQLDESYLASLPEQPLRTLSAKLLADLKAAHERLDQNPSNSSRPPSSRDPWQSEEGGETPNQPGQSRGEAEDADAGEDKAAEKRQKGTAGGQGQSGRPTQRRRAGRRPGAPGHGRVQQLPIAQTHHHRPETCAGCGAPLPMADSGRAHAGYLMIDLIPPSSERAGLEVVQSKHLYYEHDCHCGHRTRAEPGHCTDDPAWTVALSNAPSSGARLPLTGM